MKKLNVQKRLASALMKCSKKRVKLDTERLEDIKEAITKRDIKSLIEDKAISCEQKKGVSRARANKRAKQKSAGQRAGPGKRKGKSTARLPKKDAWMNRVRAQRKFLKELKERKLITSVDYRNLYNKSKGGFFRSKRHIKLYITEQKIIKKE
jgi:large subunit ribosomal protein L19e